jgi:hypothetical protein
MRPRQKAMPIAAVRVAQTLVAIAVLGVPLSSAAATPSPKPTMHFGASGPTVGLKHVGDVGASPTSPNAKKKKPCRAKGCKPQPKPSP